MSVENMNADTIVREISFKYKRVPSIKFFLGRARIVCIIDMLVR